MTTTRTAIDVLGSFRYALLTTFRRDGRPVATPVWVSQDGQQLYAWTEGDAGKAKRLRHTDRVLIAPCDYRGRLLGDEVPAVARVLDDPDSLSHVERLHAERFGVQFHVWRTLGRLMRRNRDYVALEISLPDTDESA